jgi:DNA helicase-2/ATP-dependent DNA helicase PcrA
MKMREILTENLNSAQREAVLHKQGPLIIFAGAGTGKTRVITQRIAHLLFSGVAPYSILAVTFTNKSAAEMKKRVTDLVPQTGRNVWISTFHSFCAHFLHAEALKINLNPDFLIYDFADQRNTIGDCIRELNIDEKKFKIPTIVGKISRAKDDLKLPSDMAAEAAQTDDFFGTTAAKIYELYQKKLERAGALDFGDLIMRTVSSLQQRAELLEHYQERYKYIMIDEYQDTNHAQYVFIKLLAGKHRNICVVGDDDQSVYSWRGADINNILDFKKDYPDAKSVKLEQNYRSTPKILSAAYQVVKHNDSRVEKQLWTKNFDDGSVTVLNTADENDEAAKVADLISLNVSSDREKLSSFAVFYRTNAQSRVFEEAFRRTGIPYAVIGTLRFYDRAEIKDIMAYLKLVHNPNDNVSFKRIVNIPKRNIGKTSVERLEKFAMSKNISMWQAVPFAVEAGLGKGAVNALNSFAQLIKAFSQIKDNISVKMISKKVIADIGYLKELEIENTPESKTKIENIEELISAIDDFETRSSDKSLTGYLTQIALISDVDSFDESKDKVTLMTLHLAKGLEFDSVFICGLEDGLFPLAESTFNPEELEEERRLMYVGMTRAKKYLYLCWAAVRRIYGRTRWNIPSRFIAEAGFENILTETEDQKQKFKGFNKRAFNSKTAYGRFGNRNHVTPIEEITGNNMLLTSPMERNSAYKIGVWVSHPVFGIGEIIEQSGAGDDLKLVVLFENGQWKKLLARVANLTLI